MTEGFIDSASIHGALAVLSIGDTKKLGDWDKQSLMDATYLLLFQKIGIVPGLGGYRGASGPFTHLISRLPSLESARFDRKPALRSTKAWLTKNPTVLRDSLGRLNRNEQFHAWLSVTRDLFWIHHVRMQGSLFNQEFIPQIAHNLDVPEADLGRINRMSEDETKVREWLKTNLASEEAKLANDAYVLAALVRGRLHEYLAKRNDVHLANHAFRKPVEIPLGQGAFGSVFNSEEYFVKIIIGSALLETSEKRRVEAWVDNIVKSRNAIDRKRIVLPNASVDSDAERLAAEAARSSISRPHTRE